MKSLSRSLVKSLAVKGAVAAAAIAACASASAVSTVTFDPSKIAGVTAPTVSFSTLEVLDYAVVTATTTSTGTTFLESGLLNVTTFEGGGATSVPAGYGLYVSFTAMGTGGLLSALNYSVHGYAGAPATFSVNTGGATTSAPTGTILATGSLVPGPTNVYAAVVPVFASLVANTLSFSDSSGAFSPVTGASASFINSGDQLSDFTGSGFVVTAGSGTINLIPSAVPEPETYALMLGGLAAVGFVARRRNNG